jgi:hypothetical protein
MRREIGNGTLSAASATSVVVASTSSPNGHSARSYFALIEASLTSMSIGVPGTL